MSLQKLNGYTYRGSYYQNGDRLFFFKSGLEVLKNFKLISAEHEILLLINVKMPTVVGILTFMSRKNSI